MDVPTASPSSYPRMPRRSATFIAQRFSVLNLVICDSSTLAASCSAVHTAALPTRDVAAHVGLAQLVALGREIKEGANQLGFLEPVGVIRRPVEQRHDGTDNSRRQTGSALTIASTSRCSLLKSHQIAWHATSIGSTMHSSMACPAVSSRTRAGSLPQLMSPTFSWERSASLRSRRERPPPWRA